MATRILFEKESAMTQSVDSGMALAKFLGIAEELPEVITLDGLKLVLSNKKDSYYTVSAKSCSCPAAVYGHAICKHVRRHFGIKSESVPSEIPNMKAGSFSIPEEA